MAKLSARGRKEIVRLTRETATPDGELTTWHRSTIAIMDDGSLLRKEDARFRPHEWDPPGGRLHSYGWKKWRHFKGDADLSAGIPRVVAQLTAKGWEVCR